MFSIISAMSVLCTNGVALVDGGAMFLLMIYLSKKYLFGRDAISKQIPGCCMSTAVYWPCQKKNYEKTLKYNHKYKEN